MRTWRAPAWAPLAHGVKSLILFVNFGGIDSQQVKDSLELFAFEVMPQFID